MAAKQLSAMSPGTRQRFIDYIVNKNLGLNVGLDDAVSPVGLTYREWIRETEPDLRAALETMTSDQLRIVYDLSNERPGWIEFLTFGYELQEQQEEIERQQQYHLSFSKKGGHAHPSRWQPDIVAACQNMHARNSKISAKQAYERLSTNGHVMSDGEVIAFRPLITFETFRTKYFPQRRTKCCTDR